MTRTARTLVILVILAGVAAFFLAAVSAAGWWEDGNAQALALLGFGCWLASTCP